MSVTKPVINVRDIYDAPEEYDTVDYRKKMCNQWISFQQSEPALLHSPTYLELSEREATPQFQQRKRQRTAPSHENLMSKKHKPNSQKPKSGEFFSLQKPDDDGLFGDPFYSDELSNKEMRNNLSARKTSHTKLTDMKQKASRINSNERSRNRLHSKDPQHLTKRARSPGFKFDDENYFHDIPFNFDMQNNDALFNSQNRELISSMKTNKKHDTARFVGFDENPVPLSKGNKRKRNNEYFDLSMLDDFPNECDSISIVHEENHTPQHLVYKHIREKSVAMVDASPGWKRLNNMNAPNVDLFEVNENPTKLHDKSWFTKPNDDALFKTPDNRYALQRFDSNERSQRRSRKTQKNPFEQHLIPHELQTSKTSANTKNSHRTLKTMPSQSTIFNIKCNNLVIKTD